MLHQNKHQLQLFFYKKEEDTLTCNTFKLSPNCIVIIEGIFLLRDEWKAYFDYIVFLDCPREVRYERVLHRDTYIGNFEERLKKYQNRYWLAEDYYLEKQNPLQLAHIIYKHND